MFSLLRLASLYGGELFTDYDASKTMRGRDPNDDLSKTPLINVWGNIHLPCHFFPSFQMRHFSLTSEQSMEANNMSVNQLVPLFRSLSNSPHPSPGPTDKFQQSLIQRNHLNLYGFYLLMFAFVVVNRSNDSAPTLLCNHPPVLPIALTSHLSCGPSGWLWCVQNK